jgi:hypothetical protein
MMATPSQGIYPCPKIKHNNTNKTTNKKLTKTQK